MRNKEKLHEWIDRFNTNELSGDELVLFLEMMDKDHRVREEVILDKELNLVLKEKDIIELRKRIRKICIQKPNKKPPYTLIVLMAASLLILLSLGYMFFYLAHSPKKINKSEFVNNKNAPWKSDTDQMKNRLQETKKGFAVFQNDRPFIMNKDSLEINTAYDLLACYQPNKTFENLIGTTSRSGRFRMLKPETPSVFSRKGTIQFSWKTDYPEETSLIIENNNGLVVYESDSNINQSVYLKTSFLDFGLFYFKVMRKDEVIYLGKFTIQ